jgi:hypothetical protein
MAGLRSTGDPVGLDKGLSAPKPLVSGSGTSRMLKWRSGMCLEVGFPGRSGSNDNHGGARPNGMLRIARIRKDIFKMRSSIGKIGRRLSVVIVFALAMTGATVASAGATVPMWEFTFPEAMVPSGGQVVIEGPTSGTVVTCTSTSGSASVVGFRGNLVTLRFTGCTAKINSIPVGKCASAGLAEGEITTKSLVATPEYISKASHEVGLIFNYGGGTSTVASFNCPGSSASIRGEFMAKITPINVLTAEFPLALKGTKEVQELTQFENEKGEKVTLSTFGIEWNEGAFKNASIGTTGLALKLSKGARITA